MSKTRDYADVIRAKMAADSELAAAVAEEQRIADREQAEYDAAHPWVPCAERLPEPGVVVETKIDFGINPPFILGALYLQDDPNRWWIHRDGRVLMSPTPPTHWRTIGD